MDASVPPYEFPRPLSRLKSFGDTDCADPLSKMFMKGRCGHRREGVGPDEKCVLQSDARPAPFSCTCLKRHLVSPAFQSPSPSSNS